jgi:hypothetical protein
MASRKKRRSKKTPSAKSILKSKKLSPLGKRVNLHMYAREAEARGDAKAAKAYKDALWDVVG